MKVIRSAVLATALFYIGCQSAPTAAQLDKSALWIFPGIEGGSWSMGDVRRAFRDGGYDGAIYTYEWKYPFLPLANLMDYGTNKREAARVAQQVTEYRDSHPGRPIHFVGYSGGGALAILVSERLPPDVNVHNVVLVHAAISPEYDLTKAIEHIEGRLANFHSQNDWFILGIGTTVFGTIDRKNTASAGMVGFKLPQAVADEALQSKLVQHRWSAEMFRKGDVGGHISIAWYNWNKELVSPYLLDGPP